MQAVPRGELREIGRSQKDKPIVSIFGGTILAGKCHWTYYRAGLTLLLSWIQLDFNRQRGPKCLRCLLILRSEASYQDRM